MAITVASLEAVLDLTKEKFDKGLKGARKALGDIGKFAVGTAGAGIAAGAAAGAAAIAGISAAAFDVASDLDAATADIAASLGTSKEAAGEFRDEMKSIFAAGVGADFAEIGDAIALVKKSIDGIDDKSLKDVAQGALVIQDVFEKDVGETTDAAAVLMKEFGLTGRQALDFISKGLQTGLDSSDDFLDTIREYSNLFGDAGFEADNFFSLLETGSEAGVLGTDKIADAIKEFGIRANEGGANFAAAFEAATGHSFERIRGFIASGDENWSDYFKNVIAGLNSMENPLDRNILLTELFGTQAEDLGRTFTEGLSDATTSLEDMAGATEALNKKYETLGAALNGIKRQALVALEPLGKGMLDALNSVMPQIIAFFDDTLGPAIERFGAGAGPIFEDFVDKLTSTVGPAMDLISDALKRIDIAFGGTGEGVDTVNAALGILSGLLDAVIFAIQATAIAFQGIAWALEQVAAGMKTVGGWAVTMGDTLSGLGDSIPDWLKPGSPPPLAVGLGNIASELQAMPDLSKSLGFGSQMAQSPGPASVADQGAGALGGGGVTVIVQGSINGEAHLQEVVMDAFGQLNMALAGSGSR